MVNRYGKRTGFFSFPGRSILWSSMGSQLARLSTHWGAHVGQAARTRLRMGAMAVEKTRLGMMAVAAEARLVVVKARVRDLQ